MFFQRVKKRGKMERQLYLENLGGQPLIEHVRLAELRLEVRRAGQYQAANVRPVVGDEHLGARLGHLAVKIKFISIQKMKQKFFIDLYLKFSY